MAIAFPTLLHTNYMKTRNVSATFDLNYKARNMLENYFVLFEKSYKNSIK